MNLVKNQHIEFEYPTNDKRLHPSGTRTWRGIVNRIYTTHVICDMTQDSWGRFIYEYMTNVRLYTEAINYDI
jgi:hypothetical protein